MLTSEPFHILIDALTSCFVKEILYASVVILKKLLANCRECSSQMGISSPEWDSTLYRVFKALSQGKPLDHIIEFLRTGVSPALEDASFDSKSFTPTELVTMLSKHNLQTVRIAGKPIGPGPNILDPFASALPPERLQGIFKDPAERDKFTEILHKIYGEPYVAGIGSHLHIVAVKRP